MAKQESFEVNYHVLDWINWSAEKFCQKMVSAVSDKQKILWLQKHLQRVKDQTDARISKTHLCKQDQIYLQSNGSEKTC